MPLRRTRSALAGAMLALLAMLALTVLSGWHNAVVHHDSPARVSVVGHHDGSSNPADPDTPIHVLAHVTGQWIASGTILSTPMAFSIASRPWPIGDQRMQRGTEPLQLLRPPRG